MMVGGVARYLLSVTLLLDFLEALGCVNLSCLRRFGGVVSYLLPPLVVVADGSDLADMAKV